MVALPLHAYPVPRVRTQRQAQFRVQTVSRGLSMMTLIQQLFVLRVRLVPMPALESLLAPPVMLGGPITIARLVRPVKNVQLDSLHLRTRHHALTVQVERRTRIATQPHRVDCVLLGATLHRLQLHVINVIEIRWTMTRIRRHRVSTVRSDTFLHRGQQFALRVVRASSTTRQRLWLYARRVSWASIRMWWRRRHASVVLSVSMLMLLVRAAAHRAWLVPTRGVLVCGRATHVEQVATR